jgi:TM2 domain-containing membrane protein YozV
VTAAQFAQKVREKFPQYASVADDRLIEFFVKTNPQYRVTYEGTTPTSVSWERPAAVPRAVQPAPLSNSETISTSATDDSLTTSFEAEKTTDTFATRQCVECETPIPKTAKFCLECGASQSPKTEADAVHSKVQDHPTEPVRPCVHCGQQNPEDYSFCMKCGKPFNLPTPLVAQDEPQRSTTSRAPVDQPATVSTPDEPRRTAPMAEQQVGGRYKNQESTQDKSKLTPQQKLYFQQEYDKQIRNPSTALILTLLLGGLGAHRFYLRQWGWGIAYILFAWTFIPLIVALVECFLIRGRTQKYNEQCAREILTKMDVIFSEPEIAVAVRMGS